MLKKYAPFLLLALFTVPCSSAIAAPAADSRPIIGISIDNGDSAGADATKLGVIEQVQLAGGIPVILNDRGDRDPDKDIKELDGLIVQGDPLDVDPAEYGQQLDKATKVDPDTSRSKYENKIIAHAFQDKVPVLLICGGMQRANVILGGTLHQNIPDLPGVNPGHGNNNGKAPDVGSVAINIAPDSHLANLTGKESMLVNSFHHQALDKVADGLRVVATSDPYTRPNGSKDKLVEAIEADPKGRFAGQYVLGLQFHSEIMPNGLIASQIFGSLTKAARKFAEDTKRTHPDEDILRKVTLEIKKK